MSRGAGFNAVNRFDQTHVKYEEEFLYDDLGVKLDPRTVFITEESKTILNISNSPDLNNFHSVNPYRGCEHGCIYCFARNSHEYWGFSAGQDFESKIIVKKNAPQLLEKLFLSRSWQPHMIHFSGNTDCYQPAERKFQLTRQLLSVCLKYRNPVSILTKNALVLRDMDILKEMVALDLIHVAVSLTTLNEEVRRALEPRTVTAKRRLQVIRTLSDAGIPTGVMTAPLIPGLTDHEIPSLIKAAAENGATWAGYTVVRLNGTIAALFEEWVNRQFPDKASKILNQIKECHGGNLNDSRFGVRMKGEGNFAKNIQQLHQLACRKYFKDGGKFPDLDTSQFLRKGQLNLF